MYGIVALAGAIFSWHSVFLPVRNLLKNHEEAHPFKDNPILSSIVWVLLAFLTIPFFTPALLNDEIREKFIHGMYKGVLKA